MRAAEVANLEQDERSDEMVALLNMIIYAQAIARDLQLSNSEFYLSSAVDDLSNQIAKDVRTYLAGVCVTSGMNGKAGNC